MASRKRPPANQTGLDLNTPPMVLTVPATSIDRPGSDPDIDLNSFDDYDDTGLIDGTPRLRLVDPPREAPTVIVEAVGDGFEVSRLRDNGSTVACVMWTRKELEELARRITAALET